MTISAVWVALLRIEEWTLSILRLFLINWFAEKVASLAFDSGMRQAEVVICGPGNGRDTAIRALQGCGFGIEMSSDINLPQGWELPPSVNQAAGGIESSEDLSGFNAPVNPMKVRAYVSKTTWRTWMNDSLRYNVSVSFNYTNFN